MAFGNAGILAMAGMLLASASGAQRSASDTVCLTAVDVSGRYAIAGARIALANFDAVTTTRCGDSCRREFDVAVSWAPREGTGWARDQLAWKEASGEITRVALDATLVVVASQNPTPESSPLARGPVTILEPCAEVYRRAGAPAGDRDGCTR